MVQRGRTHQEVWRNHIFSLSLFYFVWYLLVIIALAMYVCRRLCVGHERPVYDRVLQTSSLQRSRRKTCHGLTACACMLPCLFVFIGSKAARANLTKIWHLRFLKFKSLRGGGARCRDFSFILLHNCANKDSDVTHLHNSEVRAMPLQATGYVQEASLDWFVEVMSCGDV